MNDIQRAVQLLRQGELVALPTETVYGLGADALNPDAVAKIFAAKGRPSDHPLIVHLADASQIMTWAREVPKDAIALARAFWPGPLTLILKRDESVPDLVTGGQDTVGLRVPNHPVAPCSAAFPASTSLRKRGRRPRTRAMSSAPMAPGRRMTGTPRERSTMVDSSPTAQAPPSRISATRSPSSWRT